jgi:hypothetical protein
LEEKKIRLLVIIIDEIQQAPPTADELNQNRRRGGERVARVGATGGEQLREQREEAAA